MLVQFPPFVQITKRITGLPLRLLLAGRLCVLSLALIGWCHPCFSGEPQKSLPTDLASSSGTPPEIRCTPETVKPGDVVTISVEHAPQLAQRFCFQSDDVANLPLNTMSDGANRSQVIQSEGWRSVPNKNAYGGSFLNSETAGASLEIPLTGEFFRIYGFKAPKRGIADIYLDGQLLESVDTFSPYNQVPALVYEKYGLKNGPHVVRFVVTGKKSESSQGTEVSFDALESGVGISTLKLRPEKEGHFAVIAKNLEGVQVAGRGLRVGVNQTGNGVEFTSNNVKLQRIFNSILQACSKNLDQMEDGKKVLVEGDIWRGIWLETQPMGGSMYGKFDLEVARNNFDVVLNGQYEDGKFPSLTRLKGPQSRHQAVGFNAVAHYGLDLYYLLNKDAAFLDRLENGLTRYDAFLWATRDNNGNGVLEAFCTSDTGEDGQANNRYDLGRERDKTKNPRWVESVSVTADSYANRSVLAKIAEIKGDEAKRAEWQTKADELQKHAKEYFWVEERKAAFDRNSNGEVLPTLNQLNIRAMAQGLFTRQMAEDFVRHHLMNPEEFFTPYPIPSTAINDPKFINMDKNSEYCSWAGPSQGLTLQRSVKALENYGFYAEIGMIGERLLSRIGQEPVSFPVQFDPLTGKSAGSGSYGPMILATMEYFSRMYGVYVSRDSVVWSGLPAGDLEYKQIWNRREYRLVQRDGRVSGFLDGNMLFEVPVGLRVETDYEGNVKKIAGLAPTKVSGPLLLGKTEVDEFAIAPNQVRPFSQIVGSR